MQLLQGSYEAQIRMLTAKVEEQQVWKQQASPRCALCCQSGYMRMHELRPGQHTRITQQPLLATVMVPTAELPSTPQCRQVPLLDPIHSPHPACCILFAPQVALITESLSPPRVHSFS
jgi:hypothetical protein